MKEVKKIKKQIILLIFTLIAIFVTVSACSAVDIYVNNSITTPGDGSSWDKAVQNITEGYNKANNNDIVNLAEGQYSGEGNTNITIAKNLTIQGQSQSGTIINGTNTNWIFQIQPECNVIIQNLTITNSSRFNGSAIYNQGNLTVINTTFTNGRSYHYGGAIYNTNSLNVIDSTFTGNKAWAGGAIFNHDGNLTVQNSVFKGNTAIPDSELWTSFGGAIGALSAVTVVTGCNFEGNTALTGNALFNQWGTFTAHYNRLLDGNTNEVGRYGTDGLFDATLNWWGSNNNPSSKVTIRAGGTITVDPWLILTINANPNEIFNSNTSNVIVDLFTDSNSANHSSDSSQYPSQIPLTFTTSWGSITQALMKYGTGTAIFTANGGPIPQQNPITVTAADSANPTAIVSTNITIKPSAHFNLDTFYTDYNEFINNNHNIVKITNPVNYLDQVIVVFTATNMGPDPVTSLELREYWPSELISTGNFWHTFDGINWIPGSFFAQGSFNLYPTYAGPLNMGDVCWVVFGATVNASNTFITNTVTTIEQIPVDAQGYDSASADLQVNPAANLVIIKSGPSTIIAGNQITYTITATNNGPDSATNVVISDIFPLGISNVSWNAEYFGGASGPTSGTGNININLGTLPVGGSCIITVNGTVLSSTPAATILFNTVAITTSTHITNPANTTDTVSTTVTRESNIQISKTVNNTQPNVGDTVTFTVTAHNNGPSDADNIQIRDIMPSDFTNVIITPSLGTYNIETGIWTLNLTNGESATLNLTGKVTNAMAAKNTTNTAYYGSNLANATIYVPKSDLYLKITGNNNNPTVGQTFIVTYKLGNNGPDNATNVVMTIPLPDGFVVSSISGDGNWTITGNTITWTLTNVPKGDPYLYVAGWLNHAGNFIFSSSITSDTYNINTTGVTPLTINAVNTASATSTTRTIGMQETGIPIAALILAILAIISGLIIPKRK